MTEIKGLGYVRVAATDMDRWRELGFDDRAVRADELGESRIELSSGAAIPRLYRQYPR